MPLALPILAQHQSRTPALSPRSHADRLIDSHGRTIRDLRLSITDRCNFRCVYCMEPDTRFLPSAQLLTVDEISRLAAICVSLGVDKLRVTGGEPTVHPRLIDIIKNLGKLPIRDLAMTTNGSRGDPATLLAWRDAGLRRITISIDSANPENFQRLTRSGTTLDTVLATIRAAIRVGLGPVRLNAVVIRGINDTEVADLAALARDLAVEMRFIEFMPLDAGHAWGMDKVVPADEIIASISERFPLTPLGRHSPSSTSLEYAFADGSPQEMGRIGIIAPVSRPFCGACSRLRITADGKVRACLFSRDEWDLLPLLRGGADDGRIVEFLQDATWGKQAGHGISSEGFQQPDRPMSAIGG